MKRFFNILLFSICFLFLMESKADDSEEILRKMGLIVDRLGEIQAYFANQEVEDLKEFSSILQVLTQEEIDKRLSELGGPKREQYHTFRRHLMNRRLLDNKFGELYKMLTHLSPEQRERYSELNQQISKYFTDESGENSFLGEIRFAAGHSNLDFDETLFARSVEEGVWKGLFDNCMFIEHPTMTRIKSSACGDRNLILCNGKALCPIPLLENSEQTEWVKLNISCQANIVSNLGSIGNECPGAWNCINDGSVVGRLQGHDARVREIEFQDPPPQPKEASPIRVRIKHSQGVR